MHILNITEHRPYPLPQAPWVMQQRWSKLLFAHWPLKPEALESYIPEGLMLDTYDGQAWISVVPFYMSHVRPRYTVPLPWLSFFPELNIRTYVMKDDKPGVFFFRLDAGNPLAVYIAREWYQLPYFNAIMRWHEDMDGSIQYFSRRWDRRDAGGIFEANYRPISDVYLAQPDTLDYFLTERYCLYTHDETGNIYRGDIHHVPWPLQNAEADIIRNSVSPIALPSKTEPILQYVDELDVLAWPIQLV